MIKLNFDDLQDLEHYTSSIVADDGLIAVCEQGTIPSLDRLDFDLLDAESLSGIKTADFKGKDVWLFDEDVLNYEHLSHDRAAVDCLTPFEFVSFSQSDADAVLQDLHTKSRPVDLNFSSAYKARLDLWRSSCSGGVPSSVLGGCYPILRFPVNLKNLCTTVYSAVRIVVNCVLKEVSELFPFTLEFTNLAGASDFTRYLVYSVLQEKNLNLKEFKEILDAFYDGYIAKESFDLCTNSVFKQYDSIELKAKMRGLIRTLDSMRWYDGNFIMHCEDPEVVFSDDGYLYMVLREECPALSEIVRILRTELKILAGASASEIAWRTKGCPFPLGELSKAFGIVSSYETLYSAVCDPSVEKNVKLRSKVLIEKLSLYFARNGELNTMRHGDSINEDVLRGDSVAHGVNAFL